MVGGTIGGGRRQQIAARLRNKQEGVAVILEGTVGNLGSIMQVCCCC